MRSYSTKQFLEEYGLEVEKEFEFNGVAAAWAPNPNDGSKGGPRFWDTEDEIIPPAGHIAQTMSRDVTLTQKLSPDGLFLAVATATHIRIYDVENLSMTDELTVGYSEYDSVRKLVFAAKQKTSIIADTVGQGYILISYSSDVGGSAGTLHFWNLDANGRLRQDLRVPSFHAEDVVNKATKAIEADLIQYGIHEDQVDKIKDGFLGVLKAANASNVISKVKTIPKARFPSFDPTILSHNSERFLYEANSGTTQHGMRPAEELPQIVIVSLESFREICRLKGHTDGIMWAAWSLNDKIVATASWDQTFRIWDAGTGVCKHVIGATGGQNWAGKFLPDGKHLLLSGGGRPHPLALYEIETGQKIRSFDPSDTKLDSWLRYLAVHPREQEDLVIIQNSSTLLAWQPLHPENPIQEIFKFKEQEDEMRGRFTKIYSFGWSDVAQSIFIAKGSEGTTFVWDKSRGLKWRFQRQQGRSVRSGSGGGRAWLMKRKGRDWVATLDGDGAVRFWKL